MEREELEDRGTEAETVARRQVLEKAFAQNAWAAGERRTALAVQTGIDPDQVKNWFANKRQRHNITLKGSTTATAVAAADKENKENAAVTPKRRRGKDGKVAFGASTANLNTPAAAAAAASASPKSATKTPKTPGSNTRLPDAVRQVSGPTLAHQQHPRVTAIH